MMRAIAHGWKKPGGGGPSVAVAKDFTAADKGKKFRAGGMRSGINNPRTDHGAMNLPNSGGTVAKKKSFKGPKLPPAGLAALMASQAGPPPGGPPPGPPGPGGPPPGMKGGGGVKRCAKGGEITRIPKAENPGGPSKIGGGIEKKGGTSTKTIAMKGAGIASKGKGPARSFSSGGGVRGGGIESSGKTRGRFV